MHFDSKKTEVPKSLYTETLNKKRRNPKMPAKNVIFDVDLAKDVKAFMVNNDDVVFNPINLKDAILNTDDNDILRVGKCISSHIIVSVSKIDDDFLKKLFE